MPAQREQRAPMARPDAQAALTRRRMIQLAGAGLLVLDRRLGWLGCACVSNIPQAPAGSFTLEEETIVLRLGQIPALAEAGGAVRVPVQGSAGGVGQVIVARVSEHGFRAFASTCTHGGRELHYLHDEQRIECCSGKSAFDLDGEVLVGPAPTALPTFTVRREGERIYVER